MNKERRLSTGKSISNYLPPKIEKNIYVIGRPQNSQHQKS